MRKLLNIFATIAALGFYLMVLPFPIGFVYGFIAARFFGATPSSAVMSDQAIYALLFVTIAFLTYKTYKAISNFEVSK